MLLVQFLKLSSKYINFIFLDVILDVSQLTRMVMLKLKQHGAPAPIRLMQKPTVIWERGRKNHDKMVKVNDQCHLVNGTLSKIMDMKM